MKNFDYLKKEVRQLSNTLKANPAYLFIFVVLFFIIIYTAATLGTWIFSILPGIAISYYIYWRDKYDQEPYEKLLLAFFLGAVSTYPAMKMEEYGVYDLEITPYTDLKTTFLFSFFVIALSEEWIKLLFLRVFIMPGKDFNERMDGIVYSVMISMGFATMENILYIIFRDGGMNVAIIRMFTAVPAHASFAILMGYFAGLWHFEKRKGKKLIYLLLTLFVPLAVHGLYDFFIFQDLSDYLIIFTGVTLISSLLLGHYLMNYHIYNSHKAQNKKSKIPI